MTRQEYIELIHDQLMAFPWGEFGYMQPDSQMLKALADRLAKRIWSPEEVLRATLDMTHHTVMTKEDAAAALSAFIARTPEHGI